MLWKGCGFSVSRDPCGIIFEIDAAIMMANGAVMYMIYFQSNPTPLVAFAESGSGLPSRRFGNGFPEGHDICIPVPEE